MLVLIEPDLCIVQSVLHCKQVSAEARNASSGGPKKSLSGRHLARTSLCSPHPNSAKLSWISRNSTTRMRPRMPRTLRPAIRGLRAFRVVLPQLCQTFLDLPQQHDTDAAANATDPPACYPWPPCLPCRAPPTPPNFPGFPVDPFPATPRASPPADSPRPPSSARGPRALSAAEGTPAAVDPRVHLAVAPNVSANSRRHKAGLIHISVRRPNSPK